MTLLETMLALNAVHLAKRETGYQCTWSVNVKGTLMHALGTSSTPGGAMFQAWRMARDNGWVTS